MNNFAARIGLGCARLRDGPEESHSRRILDAALASGIRYFDTAPSYGSEPVLARALRGMRNQVQICTKVGLAYSLPSPAATARARMKSAVRALLPDALLSRMSATPRLAGRIPPAARGYGNFDGDFVTSSLQQSLRRLETDRLDCVLLHEPRLTDPQPELALMLQRMKSEGKATRVGVGSGYQLDQLPAFGDVAQFVVGPALFSRADERQWIGHGVLRGFDAKAYDRCLQRSGIYRSIPELERRAAEPLECSAILVNAVLFATGLARVLISTQSGKRLSAFMSVSSRMYAELDASLQRDSLEQLRGSVRGYFSADEP